MRRAVLAILIFLTTPAAAQTASGTWLFENATTLPSTDTGWGPITLDQSSGRLFIPRRADGLTVWNLETRTAITVENSTGANAVILVPEFARAYAAMTDGTVLTFDLETLKPISRTDLGAGDLEQGVYEPTQKRVHLITGARLEKTTWITLDGANGQVLGRTEFNSKKMDTPATNAQGAIFAPARDRNLLQQLDARDLSVQKTWKLGDCIQPVSTVWDAASTRLLLACRGDKPVFIALNPAAGVVATIPIGAGAAALALDENRHLLVTANGTDGTLSVIRQDTPDRYALVETISTRPMARFLQIDAKTGQLLTVAATFTQLASAQEAAPPPPSYHPDSFTVLTYRQK